MIHNWRNQAKKCEYLLKSACVLLDEYGIEMPTHLREWWRAQKNLAMVRKTKEGDFGELQTLMDVEEAKEPKEEDFA